MKAHAFIHKNSVQFFHALCKQLFKSEEIPLNACMNFISFYERFGCGVSFFLSKHIPKE